ncbi:MAG: hypothetical protein V7K67_06425 [Nostoc sp.]|uniref:hypothetical protein n=1 Tax=Nostoc sp. TaxID=1180 RepID=UPI002FF333DA
MIAIALLIQANASSVSLYMGYVPTAASYAAPIKRLGSASRREEIYQSDRPN